MFHFRNRLRKQEREQMMALLIALRNDVVSLKSAIDGLSEHLGELIENGAAVPEKKDGVTEAQVKREWFGEDELT